MTFIFKTTCDIEPHFLHPMGGLKLQGPLHMYTGGPQNSDHQQDCYNSI